MIARRQSLRRLLTRLSLTTMLIALPVMAAAQSSSPFDSGLTFLQNLFTGTIAKVATQAARQSTGKDCEKGGSGITIH